MTHRHIVRVLQIPVAIVWLTLHRHNLHPYHQQKVQALRDTDYIQRMKFCQWLLRMHINIAILLCGNF